MEAENTHSPGDEHLAPAFAKTLVVSVFVQDFAVHRAKVFGPLIFNMDECPLPAAELKMLDAG